LWYSENKNYDGKESIKGEIPEFDLHINFWSLENYKPKVLYLDIGLKIKKYNLIDRLIFYCPFKVEEKDIENLAEKLKNNVNANIIFNSKCIITDTANMYTTLEVQKEKLLIFPENQIIKPGLSINSNNNGTNLEFNFGGLQKYYNTDSDFKNFDKIYIRFRIKGNALKENIYFDSEPLNKSFESAFSGTRMIDFKINEKRNIKEELTLEINSKQYIFAKFKKVHFLVMEPSSYNVYSFDNKEMSCRELEKGLWDDYLNLKIEPSKGHILAYHWRQKEEKENFSCLIKINYSKARPITIISYAIIVIILGILSSSVVTIISIYYTNSLKAIGLMALISFIIGAIIIFVSNFSK